MEPRFSTLETRVQFHKYLNRVGVLDTLTKILTQLYDEPRRPEDAIGYLRHLLCETCLEDSIYEKMKLDLERAKKKIVELEMEKERARAKILKTPEEIVENLEVGHRDLIMDLHHQKSLLRKYLTTDVLEDYLELKTPAPVEATLLDCIQSGLNHHDSIVGVYAADVNSYDVFKELFEPIVKDYHGQIDAEDTEVLQQDCNFGNINEIENLDPERKYIYSTRLDLSRNLAGYPFIPKLTETQFLDIEHKVHMATELLTAEHHGGFYHMSELDLDVQSAMIKRRLLFKRSDRFLGSAGGHRFWPIGRALFQNPMETFFIWVNAEDHIKIHSVAKCGDLGEVYQRLVIGLQVLEQRLRWARHPRYGYLTTCPSNCGTTFHASSILRLPRLSNEMMRIPTLVEEFCVRVNSAANYQPEYDHSFIEVSNRLSMGYTEFDLMKDLQDAIKELINTEEDLEADLLVPDTDKASRLS